MLLVTFELSNDDHCVDVVVFIDDVDAVVLIADCGVGIDMEEDKDEAEELVMMDVDEAVEVAFARLALLVVMSALELQQIDDDDSICRQTL